MSNSAIFIGRLASDPSITYKLGSKNEVSYVDITLITNNFRKEHPEFWTVRYFGYLAEVVIKLSKKGYLVHATTVPDQYVSKKDGREHRYTNYNGEKFEVLHRPQKQEEQRIEGEG